jgi:hypothetical protein
LGKEIYKGNRVFLFRKHCIFIKRGGEGVAAGQMGGRGEGSVDLSVE